MSRNFSPWNTCLNSIKKVKDKIPAPTTCHYCDGEISICENKVVYGRNYGNYPWIYKCHSCDSYVGIHKNTNIPLGTLANAKTRKARSEVKPLFYKFKENSKISVSKAYSILAKEMNIDKSKCHFGMFSIEQCNLAKDCILKLSSKD